MKVDPDLLWKSNKPAPLVYLVPGGSGTRRLTGMRGFQSTAGFFYLHGYSCYIGETAGQDGRRGVFPLERCLEDSLAIVGQLRRELDPDGVIIFASCSGGTIGTHLATQLSDVRSLILWETPPHYPMSMRKKFAARAPSSDVRLSADFVEEYLKTTEAAPDVECPVLIGYGDATDPPVCTEEDIHQLAESFTQADEVERLKIPGADHNLTRGSDVARLRKLLRRVKEFIGHSADSKEEATLRSPVPA